jgi:hypothetical protein
VFTEFLFNLDLFLSGLTFYIALAVIVVLLKPPQQPPEDRYDKMTKRKYRIDNDSDV